ncbi:hypothetical protein [Rhizobium leguminosarum]|nr:hypothetical protein [Rhizobium leguminosarum]NKL82964.1 hypothetical protein [Rhizobium leguminosarum bv. viciae]NKL93881.1 hypothetical protein [Rhizobium leguminosarum bv. viciae]NKM94070.1 hypothetical protein [Rhizobium leguminosarum bv. viciae]
MESDHEPNQPSHRAIKIVAMLIAVVTLASWSPLRTGPASWVVDQFPIELTMFLAGALTAGPACFFIWKQVRVNCEGLYFNGTTCLPGATLGLMITLATLLLVAIRIRIVLDNH